MLLFLSILGIFLSLILLYYNARKNVSTIYLGIFFLLISLYGFYQYVLLYSKSVILIEILLAGYAVVFPPLFLIGPMLYWYIRSILTDNSSLKRNDIWHFLPAIIFFLFSIPYSFVPFSEKAQAAMEAVKDVAYIQSYKATLLDQIFSVSAIYLSRPILVLVYTLWSVGLLFRFSKQRKLSKVFARQYFMTKWLCLLLTFLLTLEITQIFLIIKAFEMHFSDLYFTLNVFRVFSALGLIGLIISPFFFPNILYGLPRVPESEVSPTAKNGERKLLIEERKNHQLHLESKYLDSIGQKTDACMTEFRPYLQPDFNMIQLSLLIHIPVHHLTFYFREVKMQHFNHFRNELRINHAKALIQNGMANEITLEAIGMLSGFSSRNAFITSFKKAEGISPGIFANKP
jgi:AraC-like DNA-binding protein